MYQQKIKRKYNDYFIPGFALGINVLDRNVEKSLRKFKKMIKQSGILFEYSGRKEYIKPSAIKRQKRLSAIRKEYKRRNEELELYGC